MKTNTNLGHWEKRWHPLKREWVVYAAHRNTRPWQGAAEKEGEAPPAFDPQCHLCPGNPRVHGEVNPDYKDVFIFDNDHPVVSFSAPDLPPDLREDHGGLYKRSNAFGIARVVCYDPRHNITMSEIPLERATKIFSAWQEQMKAFYENPGIHSVLIFENKGEIVGVSNPHPHCQMYAADFPFKFVEQELEVMKEYRNRHHKNVFEAIIEAEQKDGIRIIAENEHAIAFLPFFARYAYEVMVFPKKAHSTFISMEPIEIEALTAVFQEVIRRYDMNYNMRFPYVMSVYQAPVDGGDYSGYYMHLHLQPPLRQPGLKKFLAGPEIGIGNFMADTMPEDKAAELKKIDLSNYKPVS